MGRDLGPKCRKSRRAGMPLQLKGLRDEEAKCNMELPPGGGRKGRRTRLTEYGLHLREVQRVKWHYGVLYKQFHRYYRAAEGQPGNTGIELLLMLERRLDNVVYRLRFGLTRAQARQMITHGHIRVNGKKAWIPSQSVAAGDVIEPVSRERTQKLLRQVFEARQDREIPSWLKVEEEALKGMVVQLPGPSDVPPAFEPRLVVEFMSR